jgi:hypothetical protein
MDDMKKTLTPAGDESEFYKRVAELLEEARKFAKSRLDSTVVTAYYEVGRMIVEREQQGQKRARYGANLIKGLSAYLTEQYGKGFSVSNLKNIRNFYQVYSPATQLQMAVESKKSQSPISLFDTAAQKGQSLSAQFNLTWTHYRILMRIDDDAARRFYEIETVKQQWSVRQLQRKLAEWVEEFEEAHGVTAYEAAIQASAVPVGRGDRRL